MNAGTSLTRWRSVTGLPSRCRWKKTLSAPYQPRRNRKTATFTASVMKKNCRPVGSAPTSSVTASDTRGTEGWLTSARAADARSAPNPTHEGVDSGGNGPPIFYLNSIAAILRWRALAFLFRREPILQRGRPSRCAVSHERSRNRGSARRASSDLPVQTSASRCDPPRHLCITLATCAGPTPACAAASIPA